jgi:hypothetical protein
MLVNAKREYHILNLGAGVQSTTLYLMFMRGILTPPIDAAIFADTQDEQQAVYRHLEWLQSLGGPPILRATRGKLSAALLLGENLAGKRWISIPAFTPSESGRREGRLRRQCSKEYKVDVIKRTIRREVLGLASARAVPKNVTVHQYIGISMDEAGRARRIQRAERPRYLQVHFPLIDRSMTRSDCEALLADWVPHPTPRSACVYCPLHDDSEWLRVQRVPEDWELATRLDESLRSTLVASDQGRANRKPMFLHRSLQPLVQIDFEERLKARGSWIGFNVECQGVCGN